MHRYLIIFKGQVQGVGFRYTAQRYALNLGLSGHVKNLDNGNVEVEIEGEDAKINLFLHKLLNEKGFIRVDDYVMKKLELKNDNSFRVLY